MREQLDKTAADAPRYEAPTGPRAEWYPPELDRKRQYKSRGNWYTASNYNDWRAAAVGSVRPKPKAPPKAPSEEEQRATLLADILVAHRGAHGPQPADAAGRIIEQPVPTVTETTPQMWRSLVETTMASPAAASVHGSPQPSASPPRTAVPEQSPSATECDPASPPAGTSYLSPHMQL